MNGYTSEYIVQDQKNLPAGSLNLPELRDHQAKAYTEVVEAVQAGHRRLVLMAACAWGKTRWSAYLAVKSIQKGHKALFLVDNLELVVQSIETFEACGIECGVIQGQHPQYRPSAPVQIATVQTLAKRLKDGKGGWEDIDFRLIFVDEAHHWYTGTESIIDTYPKAVVIGLTATPWRRGMGLHFSTLINTISPKELTEQGWLVPVDIYSHECPSWAGTKTKSGDFDLDKAAKEYTPRLVGNVIDTWEKHCRDKSTIVYTCNKAHALAMAAEFNERGHIFVCVDGDTPDDERIEAIRRFKQGKITGISTCLIAVKGFDATIAECIVDVQPTRSRMRHYQKTGRIQRIHDGKDRAVVLDFAGNYIRNGLPLDDLPQILNDKSTNAIDHNKPQKEQPLPYPCVACGLLKPLNIQTCPGCGFRPERMESKEHIAGELVKLTGEEHHGMRIPRDFEDKDLWLEGLTYYAKHAKYKQGWIAYAYQTLFDERLNRDPPKNPQKPPVEIIQWCKGYQRMKAKRWKEQRKKKNKEFSAEELIEYRRRSMQRKQVLG